MGEVRSGYSMILMLGSISKDGGRKLMSGVFLLRAWKFQLLTNLPGKRMCLMRFPEASRRDTRREVWVVFPARSRPSITMKAPRTGWGCGFVDMMGEMLGSG